MSGSEQLARITALALDIDGVLTDGTFEWSDAGGESKRFSFEDIMGLSRARQAGIVLGLISGEDGPLVGRLARKISASFVAAGCRDKGAALREFAASAGVALEHTAFIGDDVNDLPALAAAGLSAAPANAQPPVRAAVAIVLERSGGRGAVRQFIEMILAARSGRSTER